MLSQAGFLQPIGSHHTGSVGERVQLMSRVYGEKSQVFMIKVVGFFKVLAYRGPQFSSVLRKEVRLPKESDNLLVLLEEKVELC